MTSGTCGAVCPADAACQTRARMNARSSLGPLPPRLPKMPCYARQCNAELRTASRKAALTCRSTRQRGCFPGQGVSTARTGADADGYGPHRTSVAESVVRHCADESALQESPSLTSLIAGYACKSLNQRRSGGACVVQAGSEQQYRTRKQGPRARRRDQDGTDASRQGRLLAELSPWQAKARACTRAPAGRLP